MNQFISLMDIEEEIYSQSYFSNWQLNYGLSMPVIREHNSNYFIAYYVIRTSPDVIQTGLSCRPEFWILFNPQNGSCELIDCNEQDFLDGYYDYEKLYELAAANFVPPDEDIEMRYNNLFNALLEEPLTNEVVKSPYYKEYMNYIKSHVGSEFAQFYDCLSS